MIKAGNHTVSDKGFTVVMENIGGVPRQAVVAELPGGISDEALAAFCAGPIEVLAEDGSTTATYTGPFRVVSHGLKLTRTSEDSDVAALTAQVAELEAKLSHEKSEKESAQSALARLNEQLTTLKMTLEANSAGKAVVDEAPSAGKAVVDKASVEAMDAAGSVEGLGGGFLPDLQPPGGAGAALPDMPGGQSGADRALPYRRDRDHPAGTGPGAGGRGLRRAAGCSTKARVPRWLTDRPTTSNWATRRLICGFTRQTPAPMRRSSLRNTATPPERP